MRLPNDNEARKNKIEFWRLQLMNLLGKVPKNEKIKKLYVYIKYKMLYTYIIMNKKIHKYLTYEVHNVI